MRFFAKAARVIVLFRVPPFRRIFLRSSAPKRNCAHFPQMLPPIFRRQELKVLYWAVYEMRDAIHSQLIEMPLASPVRGKAQESQQACDRLLRLFSDLLAEVGIEIESLFQGP